MNLILILVVGIEKRQHQVVESGMRDFYYLEANDDLTLELERRDYLQI